ncbi:MAG: GNAT family N-acetyltransferase [Betaproteobacteria bacterium]|nr:GNAT family N-acetyltransferase [Betaproteobacteria bacterium]MDE2122066.1 GNAT family N-acetyltransferase [Betaproteobacteria bacterium]MDE2187250.1 GNAT family N-acetyltransferase [Betaproteobacteria bacterium]MDE2325163.1 GNAT family N-acetyltransferase [Betaproteobacteria bacterium]
MASAPEQASYRVEPADLDHDAAQIVALWSLNLGHAERRQAKLDWFYRNNPMGIPQVLLLKHGQSAEPIGTVGLGARILRCGPHSVRAGLMADFAVNIQHRTLFPALTLQRAVLEQGLARHELLYGFPNAKSLPVVQRAGFDVAGGLSRYVRVLRTQDYLPNWLPRRLRRGLGGGLDIALRLRHGMLPRLLLREHVQTAWLDQADARFDSLWAEHQVGNAGVIGVRDSAFLNWRFRSTAAHRYRIFTVFSAAPDPSREPASRPAPATRESVGIASMPAAEKLLGYAVCETDGTSLQVHDLLAANPASRHLPVLLCLLTRDARRQGCRSVSLEFMGEADLVTLLLHAGFRVRESRSQPVILAMTAPMRAVMQNRSWYLTRADVDT